MRISILTRVIALGLGLTTGGLTTGTVQAQERILSIGGSVTEIIVELGAGDRVIARDSTSTWPPEFVASLPDVGYVRALSPEGVLSVAPDIIIAEHDAGPPEAVDVLKATSIPWFTVPQAVDAAGIIAKIEAVGAALGLPAETGALVARVQNSLDAAAAAAIPEAERKRVLFILSTEGGRIMAAGTGTSGQGIIAMAGGINVIDDFAGYKQLTDEAVATLAPDVILMMDREGSHAAANADLFAMPALSATQYSSFSRSAFFARNTKTVPVNGSLRNAFFTIAARLSWPLRKSMGLVATMIRTRFEGKITRRPAARSPILQPERQAWQHQAAPSRGQ